MADWMAEFVIAAIGSVVAGLIWLVRLEAKSNSNQKDLERLEAHLDALVDKHEALESKIIEKLSSIENMVSKIQGRLSIENDLP